jgi:hypothetical protein
MNKLKSGMLITHNTEELLKSAKLMHEQLLQSWVAARLEQVSGWWLEEYPSFKQGAPTHEQEELLTAYQANALVSTIKQLRQQVDSLSAELSEIKNGV